MYVRKKFNSFAMHDNSDVIWNDLTVATLTSFNR